MRTSASFRKIAGVAGLSAGWARVKRNKGAPGIDGVTVRDFARQEQRHLAALSKLLLEGSYRPAPLRTCEIPKSSGAVRRLRIPTIADRVAQSAAAIVLSETFDRKFSSASYGYRPARGVREALFAARRIASSEFRHALDADIANFFDEVDHQRLLHDLAIWIDDLRTYRLVSLWVRNFSDNGRGIAQGSPISPLLANVFLHPLDKQVIASGRRIVRYADDFLVLARSRDEAAAATEEVTRLLRGLGLQLNQEKTALHGPGDSFGFLGETLSLARLSPARRKGIFAVIVERFRR
jgi:CRISPR-associated protein Cas1